MSDWEAETNAFALSRIYGQGWTAAKKMLASSNSDVLATDAPAHNPYRGQKERLRWETGFTDALESSDQKITVTAQKSWRRIKKGNSPQ